MQESPITTHEQLKKVGSPNKASQNITLIPFPTSTFADTNKLSKIDRNGKHQLESERHYQGNLQLCSERKSKA